jgi:hypothetical protein
MSVLTLADAKTQLNLTGTTNDAELQDFIDAAEAVIGERCGPLAPEPVSERLRGACSALVLRRTPAALLTAVTSADGSAVTLTDLYLDEGAGVVTYNSGASFTARYYDVEYQVGRVDCPDDLLQAVKELVEHLWESQRGSGVRPGGPRPETAANTLPGAGYLLPFRVQELIAPHERPGFA